MKKTVTIDKPDRLDSLKIVDQSAERYSVLQFKVSQINMLIHNLIVHLNQIADHRGIDPKVSKDLKKCIEALDRTKSVNSEFNHLIEKLPEVIDGLH